MRLFPSVMPFMAVMAAIVVASNFLVQFPVDLTLGALNLADLLTWGAFTYPVAFLVTDLANRRFGARAARMVVFCGFVIAVILSIWLATPRIAVASGTAFLMAQLIDVSIFDRLRNKVWWLPPLVSTVIGSGLDTLVFFSLAFSQAAVVIGPGDSFASEAAPLLGLFAQEAPRWLSWALGDLSVKLLVGLAMLVPYGALIPVLAPQPRT
ncbi:queuosine precursor transporter [Hoeflea sp. Naph1]|uniref:queuosine precursor transporter n=1 Tax=Hoeflea sp. Naph1 TaxID=3388653 RepID=UPI0039903A09